MKRISILILAAAALSACSSKDDGGDQAEASGASGKVEAPQTPKAAVEMPAGSTILDAAKAKVGMAVSGAIQEGGTSQFYRFDYPGKLRDIVKVRLDNKSATLKPDIKIYNSERSQITEQYDGTPGANVEYSLSLNPGESIYVEVLPYGSKGAYELSAVAQKAYDANEPNDDQLHPTAVKFGDSIEGSIMDDQDNDWFHFTATSGPKVTIALENLSPTLKPDVKVYTTNKSQIVEKYDGTPGAGLDFTVDVPAGQDFYVQILPYGSTGKYRLTARAAVLANDMAVALKAKGKIDLYGIYFDTDQTFIKPESANTLNEVASLLKTDPSLHLEISGHTDNSGTKAHNMKLSQDRADAVVAALVGQYGIDQSRLEAKGYGDTKPVAPNDTPAGMAKNRRVELRRK